MKILIHYRESWRFLNTVNFFKNTTPVRNQTISYWIPWVHNWHQNSVQFRNSSPFQKKWREAALFKQEFCPPVPLDCKLLSSFQPCQSPDSFPWPACPMHSAFAGSWCCRESEKAPLSFLQWLWGWWWECLRKGQCLKRHPEDYFPRTAATGPAAPQWVWAPLLCCIGLAFGVQLSATSGNTVWLCSNL